MFDGHLRFITDRAVKPIGNGLSRVGVKPDHLTVLGLVMAVGAAFTIGTGHPRAGFFTLVASALPDLFDGAVAKAGQSASIRGAFFDSTADRVTDALLLGGIAWYLQSRDAGHAAMLVFAVLAVSTLISYTRAKAEIYGFDAKGGLMERAERLIVIGVGLLFPSLMVPILWVMLVLTSVTAVQRFYKVWNQAGKPPEPVRPEKVVRADRGRTLGNNSEGRSSRNADSKLAGPTGNNSTGNNSTGNSSTGDSAGGGGSTGESADQGGLGLGGSDQGGPGQGGSDQGGMDQGGLLGKDASARVRMSPSTDALFRSFRPNSDRFHTPRQQPSILVESITAFRERIRSAKDI